MRAPLRFHFDSSILFILFLLLLVLVLFNFCVVASTLVSFYVFVFVLNVPSKEEHGKDLIQSQDSYISPFPVCFIHFCVCSRHFSNSKLEMLLLLWNRTELPFLLLPLWVRSKLRITCWYTCCSCCSSSSQMRFSLLVVLLW